MDPKEKIVRRLVALRLELGRRLADKPEGYSQTEFADEIGVAKNVYNPFEKLDNKRVLTLDVASRIRRRFGVPTDWLYFGEVPQVSDILLKIGREPGAREAKPSRSSAR